MTIDGLTVIILAQLTFLISIVAIKYYVRRTDVLSGRYFQNDGDNWLTRLEQAEVTELNPQARFFASRLARSNTLEKTNSQTEPSQMLSAPATLPSGMRIYAIGDIHGRVDLLRIMLEKVDADRSQRPVNRPILLCIGDYVDRGPSSREVLDILLEYMSTNEAIFLKGNHETFISRFLDDPAVLNEWRLWGGLETLLSYGLKPTFSPDERERADLSAELSRTISTDHLAFLNSLKLSFRCGGFLFVHAGIRPGVPVADQDEKDLLWIREDFLGCEAPLGVFVVHGHTPVRAPDLRSNRLNIDTGAYATGRLTCAVIEGSTIMTLSTETKGIRTPHSSGHR